MQSSNACFQNSATPPWAFCPDNNGGLSEALTAMQFIISMISARFQKIQLLIKKENV